MQEKLEKNEGSFSLFRSMYIWNTYYTIQFEMMIWLANLIFDHFLSHKFCWSFYVSNVQINHPCFFFPFGHFL